jgi:hypothetical protein
MQTSEFPQHKDGLAITTITTDDEHDQDRSTLASTKGEDPQAEQAAGALITPQAPPQMETSEFPQHKDGLAINSITTDNKQVCLCSGYNPGLVASFGTSVYGSLCECGHSPEKHFVALCLGSQMICWCFGYKPGEVASLETSFYASLTPVCECGHSPEKHCVALCVGSQSDL